MSRRRLRVITFGSLAALFVLAVAVPVGDLLGVILFAVVVLLVGIWFFRGHSGERSFHPAMTW